MIEYAPFYKRFGIRRIDQLVKPTLFPSSQFFLPFNSIGHYVPEVETSFGIDETDLFLQNNKRVVWIKHLETLTAFYSEPRYQNFELKPILANYKRTHPKFRTIMDPKLAMKDTHAIVIVNHAIAPHLYKYIETQPLYTYNKWKNEYGSLWDSVNAEAATNERNQFIVMHLPPTLLPISVLKASETSLTRARIEEFFTTPETRSLLDMWIWLGPNRKDSVLNLVKPEHLRKINLVYVEAGRFCIINLGILNDWRADKENDISGAGKLNPEVLQKRFLNMAMAIKEASSVTTVTDDDVNEEATPVSQTPVEIDTVTLDLSKGTDINNDTEVIDEIPPMPSDYEMAVNAIPKKTKTKEPVKVRQKNPIAHDADAAAPAGVDDTAVQSDTDDAKLDADLELLEHMQPIQKASVEYKPYTPPSNTGFDRGVKEAADRVAKSGLISSAEYRRFTTLAERYKDLPNPFGEGKLVDMTVIKPEEIVVSEKTPLAESISGVQDESMLSCSLKTMNSRYVEKIMPKDIASMVMNIQNTGVAIQGYTIEPTRDLMDEFEIHTVKLVPVVGSPSTIRFRIPIIDKQGVFVSGGVKCKLRSQRGDVPIRKISPSEVALTSYYSKLFVSRSERATMNYSDWLLSQITAIGIDENDSRITDIRMADVFDNTVETPRIYALIAQRYAGFVSKGFAFNFDYKARHEFFGEKIVKEVESKSIKLIPIAQSKTDLLMMDYQNQLHQINIANPKSPIAVGGIESFLTIDVAKRPIEMAEIGIFGKQMPIVFVLGYLLGLGNLMKTLGVEPKRYPRRTRFETSADEFEIAFNDEVLVFNRNDHKAALVMAGLLRYKKDVSRYSVYLFDEPEVYQLILEANSLGARYTREFDLMKQMWVDHITRDILIEMREPTDFVLLLIRACELLTTEQHPDQMDMNYMRDKGYERIPGMMYQELVKALRVYKSRPTNATATVDLNPNAVWSVVRDDPTVIAGIEESNPIHNLKEKEVVVYRGSGGRSARSMTADARIFHRSQMGITSESTSDSADVGTVVYLSADPNYTTLRGTVRPLKEIKGNAAKLVSTSMLLAPGAENDDWKLVA